MNTQAQSNRPVRRQRTKSGFSLRTASSGSNSYKRGSLSETQAEKHKAKMSQNTKANPNAAMNEAQPIAAALEKATISSLSNIQCSDLNGNLITDPDRSNPTRWRMERPLDTIRSFEQAIDKQYSHRSSVHAPLPSGQNGYQSQRSSSYWANNNNNNNNNAGTPNGYEQNPRHSNHGDNFSPMRSNPRMQSDPMLNRYNSGQTGYQQGQNVYPAVGEARSKDTLNTGASSGSELYRGSPNEDTPMMPRNPSSQQFAYAPQEAYGQQGENAYGQGASYPPRFASQQAANASAPQLVSPAYANPQQANGGYYQSNPNLVQQQQMPQPPPKDGRPLPPAKVGPIRLDDPSPAQKNEQRTSWLKKRFSRAK